MDLLHDATNKPSVHHLQTPLIGTIATDGGRAKFSKSEVVEEVKQQLRLAGPLVSVNFLTYLLQLISLMFVGHLGELPLAGASMATSFTSVTAWSLLRGLGGGLETLCGQSYGAGEYHALGTHLQRATIVLLLAAIPLSFVSAHAETILLCLSQDPEISAEAGRYARFEIASVLGLAILEPHYRFLQSQNNVVPYTVATWATALFHVPLCWALVYWAGLGSRGAALANGISCWISAVAMFVYVRVSPTCKRTWTGWSIEALRGIPGFVRLAVPSAIMVSLEEWSYEMVVLLGGLLPNPKLETSVLSISLDTYTLIFMIPLGLGDAVSTRVSNELGAGRPRSALLAILVAVVVAVAEAGLAGMVLVFGRNVWGPLYSKEERVVKYIGEMMVLIAAFHVFDAINGVLAGICRGCGRQKLGALVNLGAFYLLGIPCSIVLAFVYHLGGKGLWIGIQIAMVSKVLFLTIMIMRTNWEKEEQKAKSRVYGMD